MYPRLKELRESLGMTQAEFGKSIGIAKSTYNNYETGIRDPKSDFWISVAQQYGVTIDYLMGYSDNPHQISDTTATKKAPSISDKAQKVAERYSKLDVHGQETVDVVLEVEYKRYLENQSSETKMGTASPLKMFMAADDGTRPESEIGSNTKVSTGPQFKTMQDQDKEKIGGTPLFPEKK